MQLKKIYSDSDLEKEATCKDYLQVQYEGSRQVSGNKNSITLMPSFPLATGSTSNTVSAFVSGPPRSCASISYRAFTHNRQQLAERGIDEARTALELPTRTLLANDLVNNTGGAVLQLVKNYAMIWRLLLYCDENTRPLLKGCRPARGVFVYDQVKASITSLNGESLIES